MQRKLSLPGLLFPQTLAPDQHTQVADEKTIAYYTDWLATRRAIDYQKDVEVYHKEALAPVIFEGHKVQLFAPFRPEYSALRTFTRGQVLIISLIGLGCIAGALIYHPGMFIIAIAIVTVLYLSDLLLNFILSARTLDASVEEHIDDALIHALIDADWPRYTILCPLYREAAVVPQFVHAMQALDYPIEKLQILFLTEENDNETRQAIADMRLASHFEIVITPDGKPRTKPRACNYGLLKATGDFVVIYDAEDVPDPLQLKKAVLAFANQGEQTACIQAKLNFYNTEQNVLTRWFTAEYSLWFDLTLPGLQKLGVPLPLGGTSNHFRAHLLRRLGGWDAYNVTEDCDLGLRISAFGLRTAVLDSTTFEEANSNLKNWIRQRSRWIKGYMQTYLVYMRHPQVYLRKERMMEFFSLQLFVGGKTGVLFVNPFMWLLVVVYLFFSNSASVNDFYHTLFPMPVLYMGMLCLIFGNFFYTYSHLIGCMKRGHYRLVKWTLLIPIYWAMASLAAFMALYQLILKPHYWEKTVHGLHLRTAGALPTITTVAEVVEPEVEALMVPADSIDTLPMSSSQERLLAMRLATSLSLFDEDELRAMLAETIQHKALKKKRTIPLLTETLHEDSELDGNTVDAIVSSTGVAPELLLMRRTTTVLAETLYGDDDGCPVISETDEDTVKLLSVLVNDSYEEQEVEDTRVEEAETIEEQDVSKETFDAIGMQEANSPNNTLSLNIDLSEVHA